MSALDFVVKELKRIFQEVSELGVGRNPRLSARRPDPDRAEGRLLDRLWQS